MLEFWQLSMKVARRHWLVYRQDLVANIAPAVFDPLFAVMALGIGLGAYLTKVNGFSYMTYIAPGMALSTALYTAFFESSYNFYVRYKFERVFAAMMTTPIGPYEIIMGEFIWVFIKGAVMTTLVALLFSLFGVLQLRYVYLMPLAGGLVSLACGAMGLIASGLVRNINQFQTVFALLISPMYFFSGIFYPIDDMPVGIRIATQLSPLYHGVRMGQEILWARHVREAVLVHGGAIILLSAVLMAVAYKLIYPKLHA